MTRMSHKRLITASLPTSRSRDLLGQQVECRAEHRAANGADVDYGREAVQEAAGTGVLQAQSAADQLAERAVVAVVQDGVVVGLLLMRKVGDQRVLARASGLDAVAGAVGDEGEIAGLELKAVVVDDQLAAPRGDRVEPHATRHRRDRATPRLAEVRRAIEDAGDRDVAQRIGNGRHREGVGDHHTIVAAHQTVDATALDDRHTITDGQPLKRPAPTSMLDE